MKLLVVPIYREHRKKLKVKSRTRTGSRLRILKSLIINVCERLVPDETGPLLFIKRITFLFDTPGKAIWYSVEISFVSTFFRLFRHRIVVNSLAISLTSGFIRDIND